MGALINRGRHQAALIFWDLLSSGQDLVGGEITKSWHVHAGRFIAFKARPSPRLR